MLINPLATAWALGVLTAMSPPDRLPYKDETPIERRERYERTARQMLEAAFLEQPATSGPRARLWTVVHAMGIAKHESEGFMLAIVNGTIRGDHGRSVCAMQLNLGKGTVPDTDPVVRTWRADDVLQDPVKCYRAGIRIMRRSIAACRRLPWLDRLSAYTTGKCLAEEATSRERMTTGDMLWARYRPTFTDKDVVLPEPPPVLVNLRLPPPPALTLAKAR